MLCMAEATTTLKRIRTKKATLTSQQIEPEINPTTALKSTPPILELFNELTKQITQTQAEYERLQKEMAEIKQAWAKERENHQRELEEKDHEEEVQRQREGERYLYETVREHKRAEDEFADKKAAWEKQLQEQKEAINKERAELQELRKLTATFEEEKVKAIKEAQASLLQELTEKFEYEKKLREQEIKAEKDLLNLKINALTVENSRQSQELESLKKALDETTKQVKEIAVKVIESGTNSAKNIQEI